MEEGDSLVVLHGQPFDGSGTARVLLLFLVLQLMVWVKSVEQFLLENAGTNLLETVIAHMHVEDILWE